VNGGGRNPSSGPVILVAKEASFEVEYVFTVLKDRGLEVMTLAAGMNSVVQAIASNEGCSVVVCHPLNTQDRADLSQALARYQVPCLTLIRATDSRNLDDEPVLAQPFAAYQVADWIAGQ
jgi:hypothetical protein